MELEETFGVVLKKARNNNGLSQEELAFKCGLDRTYISMLERGKRSPTLNTIFILSKALGSKPSKLIAETEKLYSN